MLIVRDLLGNEEMLTDYTPPERKRRVNGDNTLSFTIFQTEKNAHSYSMCQEESIILLGDDEYKIKSVKKVGAYQKQISVVHIFFDDMISIMKYTTLTGSLNFVQALDFVFENTGWSYVNQTATVPVKFDKFGGNNCLSLMRKVLDSFKVEFSIDNKNKQIIFKAEVGDQKEAQLRYRHNIKTFEQVIDTSNLSTRIKGYGKKYDDTDILSGVQSNFTSNWGTWEVSSAPIWKTKAQGAQFAFNYAGTGIRLWFWGDQLGGVWEIKIDNDKTEKVSTWKATNGYFSVDLFRNMPDGVHTIAATFVGDDKDHIPSTGANTSYGYICYGVSSNEYKTFEPWRPRKDEELYTCQFLYTSPNSTKYGIKEAPPFQSDEYTTQAEIEQACKDTIIDVPEMQFKTDIVQLLDNGQLMHFFDVGDYVYLLYEPHDISMSIRIIEVSDYPLNLEIAPVVTLSNFSNLKKGATSLLSDFQQAQKQVKELMDKEGNIQLGIKKLYRNSSHFSDKTGDWYISPDDPNAFVHIGAGGVDIHKGLIRIERADGHAIIISGTIQNGFELQGAYPPFRTAGIVEVGPWLKSNSDSRFENVQMYTFKHDSRYLVARVGMYTDGGATGYMSFDLDTSNGDGLTASVLATVTRSSTDQSWNTFVTMDLGIPDGLKKTIYVRLYTSDVNNAAYGRVLYISQEG